MNWCLLSYWPYLGRIWVKMLMIIISENTINTGQTCATFGVNLANLKEGRSVVKIYMHWDMEGMSRIAGLICRR